MLLILPVMYVIILSSFTVKMFQFQLYLSLVLTVSLLYLLLILMNEFHMWLGCVYRGANRHFDPLSTRNVHLMTQADTIRISMHSQRYDTLKIHMKQVPMQCDPISIRFNTMRFDAMQKIWSLLMPRGLFHKTSLPNKPGLFQLVWLIVKLFGSIQQM